MRHLIGTSAHRRDRRLGADALWPDPCLRRLCLRRANLHQRPDEPTQKPTQIGGFCGFPFLLPPTFTYNPETFKVAVTGKVLQTRREGANLRCIDIENTKIFTTIF